MTTQNTLTSVSLIETGDVIKYETYEEAQKAVQSLGIKTRQEYFSFYSSDQRLPSTPSRSFEGKGWKLWADFLGTRPWRNRDFYSYAEASAKVKQYGWLTQKNYNANYKVAPKLPSAPDVVYQCKGWVNWEKYLGTALLGFSEACRFVRSSRCTTWTQYQKLFRKYPDLPSHPETFYREEWRGWDYFMGKNGKFLSYEDAKRLAIGHGCKSLAQYRELCKENPDIPFNPAETYRSNWKGYRSFFETQSEPYYSWQEALEIIRFEEFDSREEYIAYAQTVDKRLPTNAHTFYKSHWKGWPKFLGTDWKKKYSFDECKAIVALHNLSSLRAYLDLRSQLRDWRMPKDPRKVYLKSGWAGMKDLLLKPALAIKYPTLAEAQEATRLIGIKTHAEYSVLKRYKEDPRLPYNPEERYAEDWKGWASFTGFNITRYYTFEEARLVARIRGWRTGYLYQFGCGVDPRLPTHPNQYYREEGWKSWSDFLGINIHSYETARVLLKEKGVISYSAYFQLVRKDPRFPVQPQKQYRERWVNWPTYFSRAVNPRKEHPRKLQLYVSTSPRVY